MFVSYFILLTLSDNLSSNNLLLCDIILFNYSIMTNLIILLIIAPMGNGLGQAAHSLLNLVYLKNKDKTKL